MRLLLTVVAVLSVLAPLAAAQKDGGGTAPYIGCVFPAGGKAGTSVEMTVLGQRLAGATAVVVGGSGVRGSVLGPVEEPTDDDPAKAAKAAKRKKKKGDVLEEGLRIRLDLAADAAPGPRPLWIQTPAGLSPSLTVMVGELDEMVEQEPAKTFPPLVMRLAALPVTVNGQILPGDSDRFLFTARQGQRLVISLQARALIPYIADAVPGWFQAVVTLYDAKGRELAAADDFGADPDPVLCYELPADGDYVVEVRDAIWRGREDFTYRLTLGELPFLTRVFPLGGRRGEVVSVACEGWNLPEAVRRIAIPTGGDALLPVAVAGGNALPFACDALPEILVAGDEAVLDGEAVLNGRIAAPGRTLRVRLRGLAGRDLAIEVFARRLGSPLDGRLRVLGPDGVVIAENDDRKDAGQGLMTHHADPGLVCRLPDAGEAVVELSDAQGHGGAAHAYRLRLAAPRPGFALRALPAAVAVPAGGAAVITIQALRRDGFAGEIPLALAEAPPGVTLTASAIPAGADSVRATLVAAPGTPSGTGRIRIEGRALVAGLPSTVPAVPAEDRMQAFLLHHLVPVGDHLVVVAPAQSLALRCTAAGVVDLPRGRETKVPVTVRRGADAVGPIKVGLVDPPAGLTVRGGMIPAGKDQGFITLRVEADCAAAGETVLILNGTMQLGEAPPPGTVETVRRPRVQALAPAMTVRIPPAPPAGTKPETTKGKP